MNKQFEAVRHNIEERLKSYLDRAGMYYRIFSRAKDEESIKRKLDSKGEMYRREGKKMQDIIGVRVVFYFQDDVVIFHNKLKTIEGYDPQNESNSTKELEELSKIISEMGEDEVDTKKKLQKLLPFHDKVFMPERLNIIMEMDDSEKSLTRMELEANHQYDTSLVDFTYEVQLRTVLSEGWHEVEHDLRYRTQNEPWWSFCSEESRILNGIFASLETSEGTLSRMIDEITYKNYRHHSWDAMIRFHFRRRTSGSKLSAKLCDLLEKDEGQAKALLNIEREELVRWLWEIGPAIPITTDFILFLINRKSFHREEIILLEPEPIKAILEKYT